MHNLNHFLSQLQLPPADIHKGQNGKLLIIGGSELFHAASQWSLQIASRVVDMVFYSSVTENNDLLKEAKQSFNDGIVVPRGELETYIAEADVILIGPGMTREKLVDDEWLDLLKNKNWLGAQAHIDWQKDTYAITNYLLAKYPNHKWVLDAGALQMVEPTFITDSMILTPHQLEAEQLWAKVHDDSSKNQEIHFNQTSLQQLSQQLAGATILLKGPTDQVANTENYLEISGGNPGMAKGGTGDVLAGLVASLYCTLPVTTAAVIASHANKSAGDTLFATFGPYFNASQLADQVAETLGNLAKSQ